MDCGVGCVAARVGIDAIRSGGPRHESTPPYPATAFQTAALRKPAGRAFGCRSRNAVHVPRAVRALI